MSNLLDAHVIGITISKEQYEYATTTDLELDELEFLRVPGLNPKGTGKFEFRLNDYREINEVGLSIQKKTNGYLQSHLSFLFNRHLIELYPLV